MATPLSDEIRALITFANETTEAGDTKLGDCVKTLCEGYNGGKNLPSSPLVVPSGAISSRLAALLAYANETTGAGDTTMGDAIRTLCEGYGGGELVFYEKLIGDGTAYINTKYIPTTNLTRLFVDFSADAAYADVLGCRSGSTSNNSVALSTGTQNKSPTYSIFYRNNVSYNLGATATNGWKVTIKATETGYNAETLYAGSSSPSVKSITKQTNVPNCPLTIFGSNVNNVHQTYTNTLVVKRVEVVDGSTSMNLVPCTYNGEAGMWDLVSQTFYGNAASSGQFTVEGEIVYYDRLIGDGTAYIDLGIPATTNDRYELGFQLTEGKANPFFGAYNTSGTRLAFLGRSSLSTRTSFPIVYCSSSQQQLAIAGRLNNYVEGYVDLSALTAEFGNGVTSFTKGGNAFPTQNLHIFTTAEHNSPHACSFSHFRLIRESNLLMDLKPCTYNGEAGMWDMVGWKFYGNSNTSGAFTAENES